MNKRVNNLIATLLRLTRQGDVVWSEDGKDEFKLEFPSGDIFIYGNIPGIDDYSIKMHNSANDYRVTKIFDRNTDGFESIKNLYRLVKSQYIDTDELCNLMADCLNAIEVTSKKTVES